MELLIDANSSDPALLQRVLIQSQHDESRPSQIPFFSSLLLILAVLVRFWIKNVSTVDEKTQPATGQQRPVPNDFPIIGHQLSLLTSPAETLRNWARMNGDVFVIKLGNRRVTMVNSGKAARHIYGQHSNALNSRPELWTYHNIFSRASQSTISTTPFNHLFSNAKKAAPFSQAYRSRNLNLIDLETRRFLAECLESKTLPVDPLQMLKRMVVSMDLNMCWGRRILSISDPLFCEISECEYKIMELRNMYTNFQDGIPLLRLWPFNTKSREAVQLRRRRDAYLELLNKELDDKMARAEATSCLRAELLGQGDAFAEEMAVLCLTMLGAGVGPTAAALHWGLALLAVRQDVQQKAYVELRDYTGREPSVHSLNNLDDSDRCPYVMAMAQEILRFFTPTRLGLPRFTTKDIFYDGKMIPQNSIVVMNAWACNRDPSYWPTDPDIFTPERWLGADDSSCSASSCPEHFTFSVGARSCAGTALSRKLSYVFYARVISAFEIRLAEGSDFSLDALSDSTWYALLANPKDLKLVFVPRNEPALRKALVSEA